MVMVVRSLLLPTPPRRFVGTGMAAARGAVGGVPGRLFRPRIEARSMAEAKAKCWVRIECTDYVERAGTSPSSA
jgi:hypothetical protein